MASRYSLPYFSFLLLSLFLISLSSHVPGLESQNYHVIRVGSLLPSVVCSSPNDSDPTRLRIVHRHGPCVPKDHRRKELTPTQLLHEYQSRVDSLHHRISTASRRDKVRINSHSSSTPPIPVRDGSEVDAEAYVVTVGFGTPKRDLTLMFDTGSDVTWIQCKPCLKYCYPQKDPLFEPAKSSTYHNISCNSAECTQLYSDTGSKPQCLSSTCIYKVGYGDASSTVGFFARDTLTLTPKHVLHNFRFGCGEDNEGVFGRLDGLIGLGREPVSLVSQTSKKYGGVFSYCLPSTSSSTGYLTFGRTGVTSSSTVKFTPMLSNPSSPSFYFLDLIAMSVGGRQLSIPSTVFSRAGTIIDSGTTFTNLPPAAYSALRSAFQQLMSKKYRTAPSWTQLDTCYHFTGKKTMAVPKVELKFRGDVTVSMDVSGVMYMVNASRGCLAFSGNSGADDIAIIGNVQQRKIEVVYDVSKRRIGFSAGGCT